MKEDLRHKVTNYIPLYDIRGVPVQEHAYTLLRWWVLGSIKMIVCQACYQPFLVRSGFEGDPPFHGEDPCCIGNTMLHLDEDDTDLVDEEHWGDIKQDLVFRLCRYTNL